MEERGPGNVGDGRSDLLAGVDHVDAEGVHGVPTDVIPVAKIDKKACLNKFFCPTIYA